MVTRMQNIVTLMAVAAVVVSGMPQYGRAAEGSVLEVEGPALAVPPGMPPATATAPPAPTYMPPVPPDYAPAPQQVSPPVSTYVAPQPAPIVLPDAPPQFAYVPELGYYVAIGLPYDMIYDGSAYYFYNRGFWYRTLYYGGPWAHVAVRSLPPLLVRYNWGVVHRYRDREFRRYERDREHYRGRLHRPERRREYRREEHHEERRGR